MDADGLYTTDEHCGKCKKNCLVLGFPNASGSCMTSTGLPECGWECDAGFFELNDNPQDGCECEFISDTDLVDGVDQNCDGID